MRALRFVTYKKLNLVSDTIRGRVGILYGLIAPLDWDGIRGRGNLLSKESEYF